MAEQPTQPDFNNLPRHYEVAWLLWLNTPIFEGGLAPKDVMLRHEFKIAKQGFMAGMFAGERHRGS